MNRNQATEKALVMAGIPTNQIILMSRFSPVPYAQKLLETNHFIYDNKKRFWRYDNEHGIWKEDAEEVIRLELRAKLFGDEQQKNTYANEIVTYIRDISYNDKFEPSAFGHLIAFKNCVYDLIKDEILDFSPNIFVTVKIPVEINSVYTDCSVIDTFFSDVVGEKYKAILYDLCAYCLCNEQPYQKLFFLTGSGANGKSTFLELLRAFLGTENVSSVSPHELCGTNRFSMGSLWNKKANISTDISYELLKNVNKIKEITGGDTVSIERKFKESFTDKIGAKQIFATNQPPIVNDRTLAWYRRIYLIEFPNRFEGKMRDPLILKKLTTQTQMNGLGWQCIKILKELKDNNWIFSYDINVDALAKVYEDLSNPMSKFLKENTIEEPDGKIWKFEFRERFTSWLKEKNFRLWNDTEIGLQMKQNYDEAKLTYEKGFGNLLDKRYWAWQGLNWNVLGVPSVHPFHYNIYSYRAINKVVDS